MVAPGTLATDPFNRKGPGTGSLSGAWYIVFNAYTNTTTNAKKKKKKNDDIQIHILLFVKQ
jgi:hypothetical protein